MTAEHLHPASLVDFGCGTGDFLYGVLETGMEKVWGFDFALESALRHVPPTFMNQIVSETREHSDRVIGVYRNFLTPETTDAILSGLVDPSQRFDELLKEDEQESQGYRGVLGYCQATSRDAWSKAGYPEQFDHIATSDIEFIERLATINVTPLFLQNIHVLHLHHKRDWMGTKSFL